MTPLVARRAGLVMNQLFGRVAGLVVLASASRGVLSKGRGLMIRSKMAPLAGIVFLCSAVAYAQTSAGSLGGTITDPNGASIPDAKVVATNATTGVKLEVQSTDAGLYLFP